MGDITLRDLHDLRSGITADMRHEVGRVEERLNERIAEVKVTQASHLARLDTQGQTLSELRTTLEERTKPTPLLELTPRQKKFVWGALAAVGWACAEGLGHIVERVKPFFEQLLGAAPR